MSLAKRDRERGRRIAALRIAANLVQKELADALGVDTQSVSRWERGGRMKPANLDKVVAFFNVTAELILTGDSKKPVVVVTYPAFTEYLNWLEQFPDERAELPRGAIESIKAFRFTSDYEPTLGDYIALHNLMKSFAKRKRIRN